MKVEDGKTLYTSEEVHLGAVDYFQELLLTSAVTTDMDAMQLLWAVIFDEDNLMLCRQPTMEEVKVAFLSILPDSSPGPDGFSASFFHHSWDIIKKNLLDTTIEFFDGLPLSNFLVQLILFFFLKWRFRTTFLNSI